MFTGIQTVFSSQEATQMIFMDILSKDSDIDIAEDLSELDLPYDYECKEQDIKMLTLDEEKVVPLKKRRRRSQLNEGSSANERRGTNIAINLSYYKTIHGCILGRR